MSQHRRSPKRQRTEPPATSMATLPVEVMALCLEFLPYKATATLMETHRTFAQAARITQVDHPNPGPIDFVFEDKTNQSAQGDPILKALADMKLQRVAHGPVPKALTHMRLQLSHFISVEFLQSPTCRSLETLSLVPTECKSCPSACVIPIGRYDQTVKIHLRQVDATNMEIVLGKALTLTIDHLILRGGAFLNPLYRKKPSIRELTLIGDCSLANFDPMDFPDLQVIHVVPPGRSSVHDPDVRELQLNAFVVYGSLPWGTGTFFPGYNEMTHFWADQRSNNVVTFLFLSQYTKLRLAVLHDHVRLEGTKDPKVFHATFADREFIRTMIRDLFHGGLCHFQDVVVMNKGFVDKDSINAWPWDRTHLPSWVQGK